MYYVGLDLAWGEKNRTGVAVVDTAGRLVHLGVAQDDASITATIGRYVGGDCLVAFDAPLIVRNRTGYRPGEAAFNRDFQRFQAGARPAYTDRPEFQDPRATRIAAALGLDPDPGSAAGRRAIEVYPHPATVVLFGLERTLKYKRGPFADRQRALLELIAFIEGLTGATPQLQVTGLPDWVALHERVRTATRPVQLDRDEDPVDAVICAYVALFSHHRPQEVTVYGDAATGYILTPTLPPGR